MKICWFVRTRFEGKHSPLYHGFKVCLWSPLFLRQKFGGHFRRNFGQGVHALSSFKNLKDCAGLRNLNTPKQKETEQVKQKAWNEKWNDKPERHTSKTTCWKHKFETRTASLKQRVWNGTAETKSLKTKTCNTSRKLNIESETERLNRNGLKYTSESKSLQQAILSAKSESESLTWNCTKTYEANIYK